MRATYYITLLAVISVLAVALVYSSFSAFYTSTFYALAAPKSPNYGSTADCTQRTDEFGVFVETCCWKETDPADPEQVEIHYCQNCADPDENNSFDDCGEVYPGYTPPTPPQGLFGSDILPTPSISPDDGGIVEQPPITTPTAPIAPPSPTEPQAPQTPPTIAPEDSQSDDQSGTDGGTGGGGGVKPPVKDLLPDTGITEQPDVQQPEQEQPSGQGQGPAGPLT